MTDVSGNERADSEESEVLAALPYDVDSLDELRESGMRYVDAIPILVRFFDQVSTKRVKESIVRALSVPWAKPQATEPLLRQFADLPLSDDPGDDALRWVIGNAIYAINDPSQSDAIADLARQTKYGTARQMLVLQLGRNKPAPVELLIALTSDPDVDGHAIDVLSRLNDPRASAALRSKLSDSRVWVRNRAREGLAKLDRQQPEPH